MARLRRIFNLNGRFTLPQDRRIYHNKIWFITTIFLFICPLTTPLYAHDTLLSISIDEIDSKFGRQDIDFIVRILTQDPAIDIVHQYSDSDQNTVDLVVRGEIVQGRRILALDFQSDGEKQRFGGFLLDNVLLLRPKLRDAFATHLESLLWTAIEPTTIDQAVLIRSRLEPLTQKLRDWSAKSPTELQPDELISLHLAFGISASRLAALPEAQRDAVWREAAIRGFEAALRLSSSSSEARRHLILRNNLGAALLAKAAKLKDPAALSQALKIFQDLAVDRRIDGDATLRVSVWSNISRIRFQQAVFSNRLVDAENAVREARSTLKLCVRTRLAACHADLQRQLAHALVALGERAHNPEAMREAVALYSILTNVWSHENDPIRWRSVQNDLGATLHALGTMTIDRNLQADAINVLQNTLEHTDKKQMPIAWSSLKSNYGLVLHSLGVTTQNVSLVDEAEKIFQEVSLTFTRDRFPHEWALTQYNIGQVLGAMAEFRRDPKTLRRALRAYELAQQIWTRSFVVDRWAAIQLMKAKILKNLDNIEQGTSHLKEAITVVQSTLSIWTEEENPKASIAAHSKLASLLHEFGVRSGRIDALKGAVDASHKVLGMLSQSATPTQWAATKNNLGSSLLGLGQLTKDSIYFGSAIQAFRATQQIWIKEAKPGDWGIAQLNIGIALEMMGTQGRNRKALFEALQTYRVAAELFQSTGSIRQLDIVNRNYRRTLGTLRQLELRDSVMITNDLCCYG